MWMKEKKKATASPSHDGIEKFTYLFVLDVYLNLQEL